MLSPWRPKLKSLSNLPISQVRRVFKLEFSHWSNRYYHEHRYENLSKLHPIFSRAQAILSRLNERDFEEIRTYRAPPVSVILVVEAICILFDVPPNWESGQALLHRENFFQDLEFYDKENLSQIAFRKMKQRSGVTGSSSSRK